MASQAPEEIGPGSPRKRSESVAGAESLRKEHIRPEIRDRAQSASQDEIQPPSTGFEAADRVFPIRSFVSVDPNPRPIGYHAATAQARAARSPTREGARQYSFIDEHTWNQMQSQPPSTTVPSEPTIPTDIERHETHEVSADTELATHSMASQVNQHPEVYAKPVSASHFSAGSAAHENAPTPPSDGQGHYTARFRHILTENGHAVITGRDGKSFQYCEDEPIHIPGAIQTFGVMLALREESPNQLVVRVVSENSTQLFGHSPKQLFELENFCDIMHEDQADNLLDHMDFVRDDAYDPTIDGPEVFSLKIRTPSGEDRQFWCGVHVCQTQKDLLICEFELEDDDINPLNVAGTATPASPTDTLGVIPTAEQLAGSTINISQPLRVLRNARRRKGEAASMEVFSIFTQIQEQLARANDLDQLLNTTAGLVKELTGFHRVLIYQFDSSWNGMVVAELVDPNVTIDLYKGLHFPASDIPAQARELYKINKVRLLYDRDHATSRLVCRTVEDLETPLDMTHAFLRAMSPIHVKYLAHMKVRSSMSISVNAFNDLWGLISCHSYGTAGMRVSFPIRKMCRLLGDCVSRNIERLSYASRLQARKLINTVPTEANPSGYIIASTDDLLALFDADYGVLSIRDETKILGDNTHSQELLALLEYLRLRQLSSVLASHDISKDFPDLHYAPGLKAISGLLYVPLSTAGSDFIVFFRRGQLTEIKWAGNPYEISKRKETAGYLEPRQSFKAWQETVLSQSREWTETDVETAAVLCLVYGKFIKVWRQKEAAMQTSQLTRLLLANSAHEVRTPLNAIINYLEIALEGALDADTRESLTKSHSASKSLVYVINDLLDLTNTEKGQDLIKDESFDLETTFKEAADMLSGQAKRKNISYSMTVHPGIPHLVLGDQRRVRQVLSNVISNAIQHTESGAVTTEMWRSANQAVEGSVAVEAMVVDTGCGMSEKKLESLFHELEQISTDEPYYPEDEPEQQQSDSPTEPKKRVLGLGLALTARIVHNMQGQLGVRSEEGKGSRFKILLQFKLPEGAPPESTPPAGPVVPPTPMLSDKEFTLIGGAHEGRDRRDNDSRRRSTESLNSGTSTRSGKSQADRLISAMQEPAMARRSPSHGSDSNRPDSRQLKVGSPLSTSSHDLSIKSPVPTKSPKRSSMTELRSGLLSASHTPPTMLHPLVTPPLPGMANITDSGVPMSALRMSQQSANMVSPHLQRVDGNSYFPRVKTITETSQRSTDATTGTLSANISPEYELLHVLVAEDDPVNSKIISKRLNKLGHTVHLTSNGEACAIAFGSTETPFDVVLMDIQMPIVDGIEATKMIRNYESKTPKSALSEKASKGNNRAPIFAVSASLLEKEKDKYTDAGFDGWVMKPINFARLNILFSGLGDPQARQDATYKPGEWENGGWFESQ
ncbi:uncharacterized protein N7511_003128 [Penicillium nucicola]|uniref:uncharacterized protein n=1 Tax=Penicillium nucicola TaxID=1850975 RepID=UPI0025453292|nr:uncharacterized protein N7511_003128 [Penicillium nucicola]KAJ5771077.1 hypothetical protein N7511_003128 [Penicillium nucicola]